MGNFPAGLSDPVADHALKEQFLDENDFLYLADVCFLLSMYGFPVLIHGKFNKLYNLVINECYEKPAPLIDHNAAEEFFIGADGKMGFTHSALTDIYYTGNNPMEKIIQRLYAKRERCSGCSKETLCRKHQITSPVYHNNEKFCIKVIEEVEKKKGRLKSAPIK